MKYLLMTLLLLDFAIVTHPMFAQPRAGHYSVIVDSIVTQNRWQHIVQRFVFSPNGYLTQATEERFLKRTGKIYHDRYTYHYDDDGRPDSIIYMTMAEEGDYSTKNYIIYTYTKEGFMLSKSVYACHDDVIDSVPQSYTLCLYNPEGCLESVTEVMIDTDCDDMTCYNYNNEGHVLGFTSYMKFDGLWKEMEHTMFAYDNVNAVPIQSMVEVLSHGLWTNSEQLRYSYDGHRLKSYSKYTGWHDGHWTSIQFYDFSYDMQDNLTKVEWYDTETPSAKNYYIFEYDSLSSDLKYVDKLCTTNWYEYTSSIFPGMANPYIHGTQRLRCVKVLNSTGMTELVTTYFYQEK